MKKKVFAFGATALAIALFIGCAVVFTSMKEQNLPLVNYVSEEALIAQAPMLNNNETGHVFATYSDVAENFSQLSANADHIVRATVNSAYNKSSVTQTSTLTINEVYKGNVPDNIVLYQIANDNTVVEQEEYILFLNKQSKSTTEDNVFYPVGGGQGVMRVDHEDKAVYANSEKLLGEELDVWLGQTLNTVTYFNNDTPFSYHGAVEP